MPDRRMSPADACWLYGDHEGNNVIASVLMWTDRRLDVDAFRGIVKERLLDQYPPFTQRIRKSRNPLLLPHWEDDPEFDIDYHIDVLELPEPGDKEQLEALISEQRSAPLDRAKPLWRIHIIQGYRGASAIHARLHHAIADGWSMVRVVMSLADESVAAPAVAVAEPEPRRRKRDVAKDAAKGSVDTAKQAAGSAARAAAGARDAVVEAVGSPRSVPARLASGVDAVQQAFTLTPDPKRLMEFGASVPDAMKGQVAPVVRAAGTAADGAEGVVEFLNSPKPGLTVLHGTASGKKKISWIDPIPLLPIKQASKSLGFTVNDVFMGAVTTGLRRYLLENDALTVDELLVSGQVSLRKPTDPLPRNLGNRFASVPVLLPVGMADPIDQMRAIKAQMDEVKDSMMPIVAWGVVSGLSLTTPEVERLIHMLTQEHVAGVLSNVPGPSGPLTLAGAKVLGACGLGGVVANMNLNIAIFTMNDMLNMAIQSDTAITPDPERIIELVLDSLEAIQHQAAE